MIGRLIDPTVGAVLLDGVDVRDLKLASLRSRVSVAFDDPTLFSRVGARERAARRDRRRDDEAAASRARPSPRPTFVDDLPWGLDTRVGEQGISLSGGQRQRLALARAVVGRPAVLVMDDPLSALDVRTEQAVHQALHAALSDVTAIIAVHRPSTVALADRVAFLHDGRIAAVGTHEELLATNPDYAAVIGDEPAVLHHDSDASTRRRWRNDERLARRRRRRHRRRHLVARRVPARSQQDAARLAAEAAPPPSVYGSDRRDHGVQPVRPSPARSS